MVDILLAEDNRELADVIKALLKNDGFSVRHVESGKECLSYLEKEKAKLLLLDVMLRGADGFAVCTSVRRSSNLPIIMMSANTEKEAHMTGFSLGADDYVDKPLDIDILSAKIKALMRRNYELKQKNALVYSGNLSIDKGEKQVFINGNRIPISGKEYELLLLFAENPNRTLSKEFIFQKIWGMDSDSEYQTLTVHVKMLRSKTEEDPGKPKRILTVWGVGYRYEEI